MQLVQRKGGFFAKAASLGRIPTTWVRVARAARLSFYGIWSTVMVAPKVNLDEFERQLGIAATEPFGIKELHRAPPLMDAEPLEPVPGYKAAAKAVDYVPSRHRMEASVDSVSQLAERLRAPEKDNLHLLAEAVRELRWRELQAVSTAVATQLNTAGKEFTPDDVARALNQWMENYFDTSKSTVT
jgi:hypothetical protein